MRIFLFWLPLAGTWLMMAFEGPFLAAIIARLADPRFNLAAHGVAVAFAILVEAPIIMIMTASTALVTDAPSFRKLRNFTYALNGIITASMLVVIAPPVFHLLFEDLMGLPGEVARLTHVALLILLPWPGVIGYRRFFQGLLIRAGLTRLVAYGTVVRLGTMTTTAVVLYTAFTFPGAYVGAAALSAGVCLESLATRFMARHTVRRLLATEGDNQPTAESLSYRRITHFYYPLALTSIMGLAVHPMLTFFMGRARFPVESLAVFPVVHALSFVFRALGLSYQEVVIALLGKDFEHFDELSRFAVGLGIATSVAMGLIAFTPLAHVWFVTISGLRPDLAAFAIVPARILTPYPALSVLLSFQRGLLVQGRHTGPITGATATEVVGIAVAFVACSNGFGLVGVTAAMIAFVVGRTASNSYLVPSGVRVLRRGRGKTA
jgi:hypothetical protein